MKNLLLSLLKRKHSHILKIPLGDIISNPYQPRRNFDDKALEELSQSIREHGVINPIIVRKMGKRYELISGERRVRASNLLKLKTIPAIVGNFTDGEMIEIGLLENLQREDLTPLEESYGFSNLSRLYSTFTNTEFCEIVAKRLGKNPQDIYHKLSLSLLSPTIKEAINLKLITEEEGWILKDLPDKDTQLKIIEQIKNEKLDKEDIKRIVKKFTQPETGAEAKARDEIICIFKQLVKEYVEVLKECEVPANIEEKTTDLGCEIKIRIS